MTPRRSLILLALFPLGAGAVVLAQSRARGDRHPAPPSSSGNIVVALCDGETTAEIAGVEEGETPSSAQAREVADRLMTAWRQKNPAARWEEVPVRLAQAERAGGTPEGQAGAPPAGPQGEVQGGHTYGAFSERDQRIWAAETDKFVREGRRVFHDAKALGSTIAVSCDMCHPDGANTHPETYPKFQVQLGRVALLRDMINWCIQNPTRGKPLVEDDPRLKAIEAYILAQRKGTPLEYGKH